MRFFQKASDFPGKNRFSIIWKVLGDRDGFAGCHFDSVEGENRFASSRRQSRNGSLEKVSIYGIADPQISSVVQDAFTDQKLALMFRQASFLQMDVHPVKAKSSISFDKEIGTQRIF